MKINPHDEKKLKRCSLFFFARNELMYNKMAAILNTLTLGTGTL